MKYEDFYKWEKLREINPNIKENLIAKNIISKYLEKTCKNQLAYQTGFPIEDLLYEYFLVKETENENIFIELLNSYNFNYSMSIHNAIYYLLATEKEKEDSISPLSWPGIKSIDRFDSRYILDTTIGTIEVFKASEVLSNSKSYDIFNKALMGQCYSRTYDFLKENRDYRAVLSYMPNFFYGGHYHTYLEKENEILDIASNALYYSKESIDKIFCGDIIAKLSYKQVQKKFNNIINTSCDLKDKNKLLTLTLYYDMKNNNR